MSLNGTAHLDEPARDDLKRILDHLATLSLGGFSATLETSPPQHVGLGTKTSLLLSLISGINVLKRLNLEAAQIQEISGRGGASGVGINLFFCGGVVWDGGHSGSSVKQFLPSSVSASERAPPLLARWKFPADWLVGLFIPDAAIFSAETEVRFFEAKTPIGADDALQTMAAVYHGVVPGFALSDINLLKIALERIHSVGFKREELLAQSDRTLEVFRQLQVLPRIAVGLSSLGPSLYCVFDGRDVESQRLLMDTSSRLGIRPLGVFSGWNTGFTTEPT